MGHHSLRTSRCSRSKQVMGRLLVCFSSHSANEKPKLRFRAVICRNRDYLQSENVASSLIFLRLSGRIFLRFYTCCYTLHYKTSFLFLFSFSLSFFHDVLFHSSVTSTICVYTSHCNTYGCFRFACNLFERIVFRIARGYHTFLLTPYVSHKYFNSLVNW